MLIIQQCHITTHDPKSRNTSRMERYGSNEMHNSNKSVRRFLEQSRVSRAILKALAVFCVSLVLADGNSYTYPIRTGRHPGRSTPTEQGYRAHTSILGTQRGQA